jgi:hypothetical protein
MSTVFFRPYLLKEKFAGVNYLILSISDVENIYLLIKNVFLPCLNAIFYVSNVICWQIRLNSSTKSPGVFQLFLKQIYYPTFSILRSYYLPNKY